MAPGTEVRPLSGSFSVPDNEILARPPSDSDLVLDDEVLARSGKPILLDVNGGPSQGLCHELLLVEFMIYRRFSRLHAQVLLQQHDKAKQTATHASHKWLNKKTKDMFSEFSTFSHGIERIVTTILTIVLPDLFISRLESLRRAPPPGGQSIREYLDHGPPVFMNYFEIQDSRWASYESMVEKLLRDPETAYWLDGPLDPEWCESAEEQLRHKSDRKSPEKTTWLFKMKRKFYRMAVGCLLLFWISHITAALAFALIARTSTSKNNLSLEALPGPKVNSGPEFDFILILYVA